MQVWQGDSASLTAGGCAAPVEDQRRAGNADQTQQRGDRSRNSRIIRNEFRFIRELLGEIVQTQA